MKKLSLCLGVLICLSFGCTSDEKETTVSDTHDTDTHDTDTHDTKTIGSDELLVRKPEMTLYYDIPGKMQFLYRPQTELKVAEGNDCVDFLMDHPFVTDAKGVAYLDMVAKVFNCESGEPVKVCDAHNDEMCAEFLVRTTENTSEIDKNENLMIDEYETNSDKDKYTKYVSGDCSSFCHDDADCEDFCDSAMGSICSTRCTSDDQCIRVKDDDENWISMICRPDGRCTYPYFEAEFNIKKANTTVTFGGRPLNDHVTIDWGDDSEVQTIPMDTDNNLTHTYQNKGKYTIKITGEYVDWTAAGEYLNSTAGCKNDGIDVTDIKHFGPVGLGKRAFQNCYGLNDISAKDIPDATKLTDMRAMFARYDGKKPFSCESLTRWDTSNVKSLYDTFYGTGEWHDVSSTGFNNDIGRWNTSKVRIMEGTFDTAYIFNQNIGCWDMSKVKNITMIFNNNNFFTQSMDNWDLSKVTSHDIVFSVDEKSMGKYNRVDNKSLDIGIKAYCTLTNKLRNEDIGRNTMQCWDGATYAGACKNDAWKKYFESCKSKLESQFSYITEDNVSCKDLLNYCK